MTQADFGVRRFGRVNWRGTLTLVKREVLRFMNVWAQTIGAPLVTAGLFLMIFTIAVGEGRAPVMGFDFTTFIAPGLMAMTVIQNAFANTSSSLLSAKLQGNIVDTLMPPLSPGELVTGYIAGGVVRGALVAVAIALGLGLVMGIWPQAPLWTLMIIVIGAVFMGGLGLLASIYARKFDQMAAITNFVVTPLAFLSGTFYSITALPGALETASRLNPFFYIIDGVRWGMLGVSDASPWLGLGVCLLSAGLIWWACWYWFRTGYRLKP